MRPRLEHGQARSRSLPRRAGIWLADMVPSMLVRIISHYAWPYSMALARDESVAKSRDDPLCPLLPSLAAQHSTPVPSKRE